MKTTIILGLVMMIALVGCSQEYDFLVIEDDHEFFTSRYYVCEEQETGKRIYQRVFTGDDSSVINLYDQEGLLESGELGPGSLSNWEPETKVKNCKRTTQEYFESNINKESLVQ